MAQVSFAVLVALLISTFFHRLSSRLTLKLQTYGPPYSTPLLKHGVLLLFRLLPPSLLALTFTSYTDEQTGLDYALAALVYIILLVVPALQVSPQPVPLLAHYYITLR